MNAELVADDSDLLGFPEGIGLFVAGPLQSGLEVAFLGRSCLFFLGIWAQCKVLSSLLSRLSRAHV
jgi:hypothetical protein